MIQTGHFVRKTRLLTSVVTSFAIAMLGPVAVAADKGEAQKALDRRAAQMQADGTVPNCYRPDMRKQKVNPGEITGEITSVDELRRSLISGRYDAKLVILLGSRPDKLAQCLQEHRSVAYYQLAENPTASIGIRGAYSFGETCFETGGRQTTYMPNGSAVTTAPCARLIDPKKTEYVQSKYNGSAVAYLAFYEKAKDWRNSHSCGLKAEDFRKYLRAFSERYFNKKSASYGSDFSETPCMQYYPEVWDEYIETFRQMAIKEVPRYSKVVFYSEADDATRPNP